MVSEIFIGLFGSLFAGSREDASLDFEKIRNDSINEALRLARDDLARSLCNERLKNKEGSKMQHKINTCKFEWVAEGLGEENNLKNDPDVQAAFKLLQSKGYSSEQLVNDFEELDSSPVAK